MDHKRTGKSSSILDYFVGQAPTVAEDGHKKASHVAVSSISSLFKIVKLFLGMRLEVSFARRDCA